MPLSKDYLASLKRRISIHQQEIKILRSYAKTINSEISSRAAGNFSDPNPKKGTIPSLQAQQEIIKAKIQSHRNLIRLATNNQVLRALEDISSNPEIALLTVNDPDALTRRYDLNLPRGLIIALERGEPDTRMRITFLDDAAPFVLIWDSDGLRALNELL